MMNIFYKTIAALLALGLFAPSLAFAQTAGTDSSTGAGVSGAAAAQVSAAVAARMEKAKDRAKEEIDRRMGILGELSSRIDTMQLVTEAFKQSLSSNVRNQIGAFASLKSKVDTDADEDSLKADVKTVMDSHSIFALVLQQIRIAAAADRIVTIATMMSVMGAKLQARLQAGQTAGNDVSALATALQDFAAKIQSAQTQAQASVTASAALQPDNGDKTIMKQNLDALAKARAGLVSAQKDLIAARKDIETILKGIRAFKVSAPTNASSTTQVTN